MFKYIRDHIQNMLRLNEKSFEDTVVDRDNLEDFRIHAVSAIELLTAEVEKLKNPSE